MADIAWWQEGVIYQIYPLSFADSDGDGMGDLRGIISRLDYLNDGTPASLGVDAIWLSPVYPSPWHDGGYDVSDYTDIAPAMGTLADFDELVDRAHARGIRIILDLVLNHTSDQHPWFVASRASRDDPRRDWYLWHDGGGPRRPPNNWRSRFGGRAWTWDAATRQWYMHGFLPEQPDVNWRNPQVKAAMWDVARFWLERGVDGFRLDVVNHYIKDDQWRDNPTRWWHGESPLRSLVAYDRQWHIYDRDRPELRHLLREFRQVLDAYPERMSVGEISSDDPLGVAAALCGPELLHLAFNFAFTQSPWRAAAFQEAIRRWEAALAPGSWPTYTLSNHDVPRHYSRYGRRDAARRARVAAAMLLTLRGTPFLYYGEEIGMRETAIPRRELMDPVGKRYWPFYRGRDGCRTPMQWDATAHAGFSPARPWLRVNEDYARRNVAAQRDDPRSLLSFYRQLIWLRKATPALTRGSYEPFQESARESLAFLRRTAEQTVLVVLNFTGRPIRLVPDRPWPARRWRVLLSTGGRNGEELPGLAPVFAPYEVCIMEAL